VRQPSWAATSVTADARHVQEVVAAAARRFPDPDGEQARGPVAGSEADSVAPAADSGPRGTDSAARGFTPADDDPTRVVSADTPSRRADAGMAWGTLIHGLLEHAMRFQNATPDDLRRLAMWLTVDEPQLRPVIEDAIATVQHVAAQPFWAEARASSECYEEVPFARRVDEEKLFTVLAGAIDLVHKSQGGWSVVDYKTDAGSRASDLDVRYRSQIDHYAKVWSALTHQAVVVRLVQARPGPEETR
jgi:ATP-dependent exoDNAse (exonuclease V) beta subunit